MTDLRCNVNRPMRTLLVTCVVAVALFHNISVAVAAPNLSVALVNTPLVDPDGAGPLAPVPLPANVSTVNQTGYIRHDALFSNTGPDPAANFALTIQLPFGETFVGALATGGVFVPATQPPATPFNFTMLAVATTLNCTVTFTTLVTCVTAGGVDLPAATAATLTVFGKVSGSTIGGTALTTNAAVSPPGTIPTSNASTTVAAPLLGVTLTNLPVVDPDGAGPLPPNALPLAPPGSVSSNGYVRYDAAFSNTGPGHSNNTVLTLQLPPQTLFVGAMATGGVFVPATQPPSSPFTFTIPDSAAATIFTCTVTGNTLVTCLPPGGFFPGSSSGVLRVFGQVQSATAGGTVLSATAAIAPTTPPATSTATITVAGAVDISVTNVDTPDPVIAGNFVSYLVTVTNAGPSYATAVGINFPLDANTSFVSLVASPGANCAAPAPGLTGTPNCTYPAGIAPLGQVAVSILARVNPAYSGSISATATVSTTASDVSPANNSATAVTTVNPLTFPVTGAPSPYGTITCPSPVQYGQTTTCTITALPGGGKILGVSGCGGVPGAGGTFTTGPITAACTVFGDFDPPKIPTLSAVALAVLALLLAAAAAGGLRRRG